MKKKSLNQLWREFCGGNVSDATIDDWEAFRKVTFARWCIKSGYKLSYADVYDKFMVGKEYGELLKIKSAIATKKW